MPRYEHDSVVPCARRHALRAKEAARRIGTPCAALAGGAGGAGDAGARRALSHPRAPLDARRALALTARTVPGIAGEVARAELAAVAAAEAQAEAAQAAAEAALAASGWHDGLMDERRASALADSRLVTVAREGRVRRPTGRQPATRLARRVPRPLHGGKEGDGDADLGWLADHLDTREQSLAEAIASVTGVSGGGGCCGASPVGPGASARTARRRGASRALATSRSSVYTSTSGRRVRSAYTQPAASQRSLKSSHAPPSGGGGAPTRRSVHSVRSAGGASGSSWATLADGHSSVSGGFQGVGATFAFIGADRWRELRREERAERETAEALRRGTHGDKKKTLGEMEILRTRCKRTGVLFG